MMDCWNEDWGKWPSFEALQHELEEFSTDCTWRTVGFPFCIIFQTLANTYNILDSVTKLILVCKCIPLTSSP